MRTPYGTKIIPVRWIGTDCIFVSVISRSGAWQTHVNASAVVCESEADRAFIRSSGIPCQPNSDAVCTPEPQETSELEHAIVHDPGADRITLACMSYAQQFLARVRQSQAS